ncbi:MAG: AAA family ATPase, partial [Campylobacterota bacterium]|nr:AAA family ATPase [Campylobacterota bacterium]
MELNAGGLSSLVVGRDKEIKTLKTYIKFSQHTVISAPRRYGKTTLANKVLDDLEDEYLIVKLDIFEATSIEELCKNYLNAIYRSIGVTNFLNKAKESIFTLLERFKLSYEHEGIKIGYEISKQEDENKLVEQTFHFANKFASLMNKKMIVFMDEFGDIEKFGQNFIKKLRSYMQTHKNVIYIFAGSQTSVINNIFLNKENAFFNFASLMNLNVLDTKSAIKF